MSLSAPAYSNAHSSSPAISLAWVAEDYSAPLNSDFSSDFPGASEARNRSMIDYSVAGNRLRERAGYIELVPKTPAEVFGERVLGPLLNATYSWSIYTFEMVKNGFQRLDGIFARALFFLPKVEAEGSVLPRGPFDREGAMPGEPVYISEEARKPRDPEPLALYLPGSSRTSCPVEVHIDLILKQLIDVSNPRELRRAYIELEHAANRGDLEKCHQNLMHLIRAIDANSPDYQISKSESLPGLLTAIVSAGKENYDFENRKILSVEANELSQKIIGFTHVEDIASAWIDLLLRSTSENIEELALPCIKTTIKILEEELKISPKQRDHFCEIIDTWKTVIASEDEQAVIKQLSQLKLDCSGSDDYMPLYVAGGLVMFALICHCAVDRQANQNMPPKDKNPLIPPEPAGTPPIIIDEDGDE